jgi:4-hydroxy-tetrahydrodipicolinate synthase
VQNRKLFYRWRIEYLVILQQAENATLSQDEKELVIKTVVDCNKGRLPLVLGVGGNDTRRIVELKTRDFLILYKYFSILQ